MSNDGPFTDLLAESMANAVDRYLKAVEGNNLGVRAFALKEMMQSTKCYLDSRSKPVKEMTIIQRLDGLEKRLRILEGDFR